MAPTVPAQVHLQRADNLIVFFTECIHGLPTALNHDVHSMTVKTCLDSTQMLSQKVQKCYREVAPYLSQTARFSKLLRNHIKSKKETILLSKQHNECTCFCQKSSLQPGLCGVVTMCGFRYPDFLNWSTTTKKFLNQGSPACLLESSWRPVCPTVGSLLHQGVGLNDLLRSLLTPAIP